MQAILDGASQIAVPALVSTLAICIVFVPMFFLSGVARYLFVPLAEAVVSRCWPRTCSRVPWSLPWPNICWRRAPKKIQRAGRAASNPLVRMQQQFEHRFDALRDRYHRLLERCIDHRGIFAICFLAFCVLSFALLPLLGQDFFPAVDSGEFKLHMRAPTGTRIEETAALCDRVEADIRKQIPQSELVSIIDNIGLPYSSINLSYSNSAPIGTGDADILAELSKDIIPPPNTSTICASSWPRIFPASPSISSCRHRQPDSQLRSARSHRYSSARTGSCGQSRLRRQLAEPAEIRSRHGGSAHPTGLQSAQIAYRSGPHQSQQIGYTARDVANNVLISLSGSFQTTPNFWLDPTHGVSYSIATQTPQYRVDSCRTSENIPLTGPGTPQSANSGQRGFLQPRRGNGRCLALQHHAGDRYLSARCRAAIWAASLATSHRSSNGAKRFAARVTAHRSRTDCHHGLVLRGPAGGPGLRHRAGLSC